MAEVFFQKKSKGSEAKMSYALMENRHGLLVDTMVTLADGTAERDGPGSWPRRLHPRSAVAPIRFG